MSVKNPLNKRVLVTGGASGIGAEIVERCRLDGYTPIVLDRHGENSIICDLADPRSTESALKIALHEGPITRLVNNVGAVFPNTLTDQTLDEFNSAIALNLRSAFLCAQAVIPGMRRSNFGRIVSISSRAALGKENRTAYSATKAGLQGMTRTWAVEEGRYGITTNTVCPGPIRTQLFGAANPSDSPSTKAIVNSIPVKRMGNPSDVAHAVSFLLDTNSSFITGQSLYVCGGMTVGAIHD